MTPDRCEKVKSGGPGNWLLVASELVLKFNFQLLVTSFQLLAAHRFKPSSMSAITIIVLRWNACLSKIRLNAGTSVGSETTMV